MAPAAVSDSRQEVPATSEPQTGTLGKHDPDALLFGKELDAFKPPQFEDKEEERQNLKERLAAGIRIFGKFNFDHHIVSLILQCALI